MSAARGTDTGAQGEDPWAPVPVMDDPWAADLPAGAADAADDTGSAWSDTGADDAWSAGEAGGAWHADNSGDAWAGVDGAEGAWGSVGADGARRSATGPGRSRRGSEVGDQRGAARGRRDTRDATDGGGRITSGSPAGAAADGDGPARRAPAGAGRTTGSDAGRPPRAETARAAGASRRSDRRGTGAGAAGRRPSADDQPVSLADLAGLLVPASELKRPGGPTGSPRATTAERAAADQRPATAEHGATGDRGATAEYGATGQRGAPVERVVAEPTASALGLTPREAPASTVDADPDDGSGPDRPVARSGTRRGGRSRRAPATEPPTTGSAAVDAEPDPESVARAIVLRQLTAAPRSRRQLAEALARREVPEDVAERVLDRFTEVGLIDDAAYAEMLVRSRHAERGLSRRALTQELRRKGVSPEDSAAALDQVDDDDEEQAARALLRKKLRATRGLDREVRMRRAYGALGRKGYGAGLVSRLVREELAAEEDGTADD